MPLFALAALVPAAALAVEAPITAVTVFSDRARVTRAAEIHFTGTRRLELPLLNDSVDPDSIRVEASGGDVQRIDIAHVDAEEFPRDEARALLGELEALDDRLARLEAERDVHGALLGTVRRLMPQTPMGEPLKAPPRLNPSGWAAALAFAEGWEERLQAKVREANDKLVDLRRERDRLVERAALLGGAQRRSGYRVVPTVEGRGGGRLIVTYMIGRARWYPSYDIQLLPEKGQVQIAFAGLVSQESGEDWTDAPLTLSTAVPASSVEYPRLLSWKIGERDRFVPTPRRAEETPPPAPRPVPPLPPERADDLLRQRLAARVGGEPHRGVKQLPLGGSRNERDGDGVDDLRADRANSREAEIEEAAAPTPEAVAAPAPQMAPAAAAPMRRYRPSVQAVAESTVSLKGEAAGYTVSTVPTAEVGLAPPRAYQAPTFSPDLPVSLAGGYDLVFPSLRPETVRSGKGARRVALFAETWPVTVERRLFPALAPEAYLVAEIKNPSPRVLPGGRASLFVGADPAGVARLKLVASGETFTLPLGLDQAVKPIRNVRLVQTEKGVFSKDDVGEYTVTTEIANPYRFPLAARVIDQYPITSDKNVDLKLLRTDPGATVDKVKGSLEWRITIPAGGKSQVSFVYTLRRPKSWRLHQN